jgi:hypothetical protein
MDEETLEQSLRALDSTPEWGREQIMKRVRLLRRAYARRLQENDADLTGNFDRPLWIETIHLFDHIEKELS